MPPPAVRAGAPRVLQGWFLGGRPGTAVLQGRAAATPALGQAFQVRAGLDLLPRGGGQQLPEALQAKLEELFGASLADVRIHVGREPLAIGAHAFTSGSDVVFAPGQFDPRTAAGQRLLGHELTHVLQQRSGRARNPFGSGLAIVQDQGLEAEAERMGLRAASLLSASAHPVQPRRLVSPGRTVLRAPAPGRRSAVVQRHVWELLGTQSNPGGSWRVTNWDGQGVPPPPPDVNISAIGLQAGDYYDDQAGYVYQVHGSTTWGRHWSSPTFQYVSGLQGTRNEVLQGVGLTETVVSRFSRLPLPGAKWKQVSGVWVNWHHVLNHTYAYMWNFDSKSGHSLWPAGTTATQVENWLAEALATIGGNSSYDQDNPRISAGYVVVNWGHDLTHGNYVVSFFPALGGSHGDRLSMDQVEGLQTLFFG